MFTGIIANSKLNLTLHHDERFAVENSNSITLCFFKFVENNLIYLQTFILFIFYFRTIGVYYEVSPEKMFKLWKKYLAYKDSLEDNIIMTADCSKY